MLILETGAIGLESQSKASWSRFHFHARYSSSDKITWPKSYAGQVSEEYTKRGGVRGNMLFSVLGGQGFPPICEAEATNKRDGVGMPRRKALACLLPRKTSNLGWQSSQTRAGWSREESTQKIQKDGSFSFMNIFPVWAFALLPPTRRLCLLYHGHSVNLAKPLIMVKENPRTGLTLGPYVRHGERHTISQRPQTATGTVSCSLHVCLQESERKAENDSLVWLVGSAHEKRERCYWKQEGVRVGPLRPLEDLGVWATVKRHDKQVAGNMTSWKAEECGLNDTFKHID